MKLKPVLPFIILSLYLHNAQAVVVEDLSIDNSTYDQAQFVGDLSSLGSLEVLGFRGSLFGGFLIDNDDVDYYSFSLNSPGTLSLNVLTPNNNHDPILGLFDGNGNLLAQDDDSGINLDAFLQYFISAPGTYIAAVNGSVYPIDFSIGGESDFVYKLTAEFTPVPIPAATWLFSSALLCLLGARGRHFSA